MADEWRFGEASPKFWADISKLAGREIIDWDDLYPNELENLVLKFYYESTTLDEHLNEIVENNFRGIDYGVHTGAV